MGFLKARLGKIVFALLFVLAINNPLKAQTTLAAGDIAFTGYISNDVVDDRFSFTLLVPVTANTVIKFTDFGWRTDIGGGAFANRAGTLESELTFTTGSAFPAGTEIMINSNNSAYPAAAIATVVGGGSAGTVVTSVGAVFSASANFSLPTSGDQIFAYQGTFAAPVFITGIHMNVYSEANGDPVVPGSGNTSAANWDGVITTPASFENGNSSGKPAALITGTNAIWIGTAGNIPSEEDNGIFNCVSAPIGTPLQVRTACNTAANWITNDVSPSGLTLPTGCNFIGYLSSPPAFTTHPSSVTICENAGTSFTIVATGAASYQWQVDQGGGFNNIVNNATYSGATTTTLTLVNVPASFNGYLYRCVATNGSGSTNSNSASLTVTALPVNPTLLAKTPNTATVADGTPVSATFNAGTGGSGGCVDDYRFTTNGGASYLPYTPGSNISTTGLAAGSGVVTIEGRRAGCVSCSNNYVALATWIVTPLPAAATTLNAGDIAFTGYNADAVTDEFSFVLLRNIGPGTVINFTDNGFQAGVLTAAEQTITWTSNAAYAAGTEIYINGLTATLAIGGSAGTVTGTALSLITGGDQILAYRGTAAAPTFISGIHMNAFSIAGGDLVNTTAAAWDGAATGTSASALPPGLITGTNAIWIGSVNASSPFSTEWDNAKYGNCSGPGVLGPINTLRSILNNPANWVVDDINPVVLPTGCPYMGSGAPPAITGQPSNSTICEGTNTSFSITATGALSYQWQVDNGGGFANVTNDATYSGATTNTLNITAAPLSFNGYIYRCIATNPNGSTNSNNATLTVNALPVSPTLLLKTPASVSVADGIPVSATFNPGSGGTGCADDFRYTTNGGVSYLPYTPGSNISTTGLAAGSGFVFIEGRRANCSAGCQGAYTVLAAWRVTPLPAGATTLNAGDIAFSAYTSTSTNDDFSFVLLRNIGPGTVINFTDNGWLSTNVFRTGETTVTWTAPAGGLPGGTEITISGLTASRSGGGAAGTVTGTALSLSVSGDQILAYRGTAAAPTFISAIHMNAYSTLGGDPSTTSAAAWDGAANTSNASALPTGLTTGVNAIWIGSVSAVTPFSTEFDNAKYGTCTSPALNGSLVALRAALNNQANWTTDNSTPPSFTQPTGCNYLGALSPDVSVTGTPLAVFNSCSGSPSAEQNFSVSGSNLTTDIVITAPAGFEISLTSGSGFAGSLSLTPASGIVNATTIYVRLSASASGTPSGNITVATTGVATINIPVSGTVGAAPTTANAGPDASVCSLTATLAGNTPTVGTGTWIQTAGPGTSTFTNANSPTSDVTVSVQGAYTFTWTISSGGCTPSSDDVIITFTAPPTTANAGPDLTRCGLPASAVMAGNTATVGTGTWTQTAGPVSATIVTPGSPTTNITGMTAAGTYTFRWTISNAPCPDSFDEIDVVVSPNPAAFTITGGGNFCPPGTTLAGPVDPNYTYQWGRSYLTAPFTNMGTAQTQAVTASGNYQLTVTNQFGCSTSATTIVNVADYVFTGSLGAGDPQQTGRINRFAQISTCASPKACPGLFTPTGARFFDSYTITNIRNVPVCATIGHNSGCGTNAHCVAYLGSFEPSNPCTNYLGDAGSSPATSIFFEVTIPANSSIVVVVHEVNPGTGCANYTLTVDVPRDPSAINVSPTPPVCAGATVTLTAPVANTYLWNPGGATTQAINVTPTTTTNYDVTLGYGNNGCTNNISTSVTVNPVATANAGPDDATCGLTYPALAANTPVVGTGAWSQVSGPGTSTFTNGSSPTSGVTVTANGIYVFRWTVTAGAPCPGSAQDDVQINFAGDPSTANAGTDKTACVSPGTATMTATVPAVGTGAWTQVAGPVTANIISPAAANTIITGLNTPGTYTFRWTVSNAPCNANFDDVDVVVNSNPPVPTITGGGTFCPPGTTLAGPVDPNYTYQWGRSLLAAPFTNLGTSQTQAVTASGNYQLTVTNQFGCSASAVTVVNVADYVFNGSLGAGDAQQTGRLNRFAQISTCAAPKACPGTFTTTGARFYDAYTITNIRNVPVCATIGLNSGCGTAVFSVAYSGSFNPTAPCTNYLADPGSSPAASIFYEATIPANGTIVVVVHEVNPGQLCANYTLTVDVPRDLSPINANPPSVVCNGTSTLTAPVANTYLWSPGGQTTQSIVTPPLFVPTTFSVTLGYGNNGCTRSDNVTVGVTSLPPTISCPANISLNNTTGQCGRAVTYTTTVGGLPTPTVSYTFTGATTASGTGDGSGSFFNVGTTNVTVTVTNPCGTASCSFTVTINDTEPPTVTTGTISSCYPTAAAAEAAALAATSATDNCPGVLTEVASTVGTCSAIISVTTTDVANNSTVVTYNTRIDNTPPSLTCPAPVTVSCVAQVPAVNINDVTGVTDNCPGAITVTHQGDVISGQTCPNRYTITRTYRATDGCGNFTECTQIITVNDQTPPTLTCPSGVTVCGPAAVPAADISLVTNLTDNCGGTITVTHQGDASTPTPFAPYNITRTYRATDVCGNFAECQQTITVNPIPNAVATPASQVVCSGFSLSPIILTGNVVNTIFNWTRDNNVAATGIAANGIGDIQGALTNTTNAPVTVTFTITPTFTNAGVTCTGSSITATVVVNPTPNTVATPATQTVCSGSAISTIALTGNVAGTVFDWTRNNTGTVTGIAASGSGDISGTLTNTTTFPITVTFTIIPSYTNAGVTCTGTPITATVVVNPIPNAVATPASQTICSGSAIMPVTITGNVIGTVFNWTRNNTVTVTGIAASGSGNIGGSLTNTTNAPVTVTFTITPSFTNAGVTCMGTPVTVAVIVNPIPNAVATPASQTICSGSAITTIVNSGNVAGTVFNWTRDNTGTATGIAASGSGNISGSLTNTTTAPVTVTFTITPSFTNAGVTCTGIPITATVVVNPIPNAVATPASQTICSGSAINTIVLAGNVSGTVYNWTRNNTATVTGIAATGSGNISGSLTNTTTAPVTVTFTITPGFTNAGVTCTGTPITATVVVNPIPNAVATPTTQTVCSGVAITPIVLSGSVAGTVYNWTRDNLATVSGIAASGSGNISGIMNSSSTVPVTVTFTITPGFTNGGVTCTGTSITATVIVNPIPTIICPANIVVNAAPGTCSAIVNYPAATVTGTPTPIVSYSHPSGSSFPVGVTTVSVIASNNCGAVSCSFTITVNDVQVPVITTQPVNRSVCVGSNITFSVVASNAASYQWQRGTADIPGATSATLTLNNVPQSLHNSIYRVRITGPCGTVVFSNTVTLTVNPLPYVIINSLATPELVPGRTTTILSVVSPPGGTYAWLFNGAPIAGASGPALGPLSVDNIGRYNLIYTDPNGCVSTSSNFLVTGQASFNFWVYPNPNTGTFQVRFNNQNGEVATVNVYDPLGQRIHSQKVTTGPTTYARIDVVLGHKPAAGIYTVELRDGQDRKVGAKQMLVMLQ